MMQPSAEDPLLCHNLVKASFEDNRRAHFPDDFNISVTAINMVTHKELKGVTLRLENEVDDRVEVNHFYKLYFVEKITIN